MVTKRRGSRKGDNPGSSRPSLESLNDETKLKLLDMQLLNNAINEVDIIGTADQNNSDSEDEEKDKNDENISTPKMNTLIGFLRISNFISSSTVISILTLNLMSDKVWASDPSQNILTIVQIVFLAFLALVICVDSIGTVSFCWREYGELSCLHTDATSVIFILCSNRWIFRLGSGLLMMTSLSLPIMSRLEEQEVLPHALIWVSALVCLCFVSAVVGFLLSFCVPTYRIPWLQGSFNPKIVHDDDDIWKRNATNTKTDLTEEWKERNKTNWCVWVIHQGIQILGMLFCFSAYVLAASFHAVAFIALAIEWPEKFAWKNVFLLITISICILLELSALGVLTVRMCKKRCSKQTWVRKSWIPIYIWIIAPHLLSCGVREFMNSENLRHTLFLQSEVQAQLEKFGLIFTWTNVMVPMVILGLFYILIGVAVNWSYVKAFWGINFNSDRTGSRKIIRLIDTLATLLSLYAMIIGFASLFIDQFDIAFSPDGFVKDVVDACEEFKNEVKPLATELKKLINAIDRKFTCEDVYATLGTSAAVSLFAGFFPGAGSVASVSARSAYYGVRTASALTNLAKRLKKSMSTIWSVSRIIAKISYFLGKNAKEIILASNSMDIGRLLPLLPPVVLV